MGTVKRYLKCLRRVGVVLGRTRTHVRVAQCIMVRVASVCWNTAYIFLHSADWARYIQSPGFQHLLVTHVRKMPCKLIVCLLFLVLYSEPPSSLCNVHISHVHSSVCADAFGYIRLFISLIRCLSMVIRGRLCSCLCTHILQV